MIFTHTWLYTCKKGFSNQVHALNLISCFDSMQLWRLQDAHSAIKTWKFILKPCCYFLKHKIFKISFIIIAYQTIYIWESLLCSLNLTINKAFHYFCLFQKCSRKTISADGEKNRYFCHFPTLINSKWRTENNSNRKHLSKLFYQKYFHAMIDI